MKKVVSILSAAAVLIMAVACGAGKKVDVKAESLGTLEKMMTAFESADAIEFQKLQEQFGTMLAGLSTGDATELLTAFKEFRNKVGGSIFDEKFNDFLWKFTLKSDTNAEFLTRLYDALEANKDDAGNAGLLELIGTAIDNAYNSESTPDKDNFITRIDKWLKAKLISLGDLLGAGRQSDDTPEPVDITLSSSGIGPVSVGGSIKALPKSYKGLYDSLREGSEEQSAEGGDVWEDVVYYGIRDGKEIFKIVADGDNIYNIVVISPEFRTEEGLGADSTVQEILAAGGKAYAGKEWWEYYDGILCNGYIYKGLTLSKSGQAKISRFDEEGFVRLNLSDLVAGSTPWEMYIPSADWRKVIEDRVK